MKRNWKEENTMSIDTQRTVADIALKKPQAAAIFEKLGIDYCCNGRQPLAAACEQAGVELDRVRNLLEQALSTNQSSAEVENWSEQSLASLIHHIVRKHHAFCREECLRLEPLLAKVVSKHGENHPELERVQAHFTSLRNELSMHLMKEEQMLFPYIVALEESEKQKSTSPRAPFGTIQNPVRMMMQEHDKAGHLIRGIRGLTENFTPPEDACNSFKALYQGLEAFETDLHQHIHLENNLLFPRAVALEDAARSSQASEATVTESA
jgi:regulator of cell morphogenesis and NO signaling